MLLTRLRYYRFRRFEAAPAQPLLVGEGVAPGAGSDQGPKGMVTPCCAYSDLRYVLRWMCGPKGGCGKEVALWQARRPGSCCSASPLSAKLSFIADRDRWLQAAGGRQWLQAEVEQPGGGNAVSVALRARFRRTTELENASRLTTEQEAMAAAMPRWFALLLRAVRASAATGGQDANPADSSSRPAWRGVPGELSEQQVLEEVVIALRRSVPLSPTAHRRSAPDADCQSFALRSAGSYPLYREAPSELPADTTLSAVVDEAEVAALPSCAQVLGPLHSLVAAHAPYVDARLS